jgi:hypothetical protein
VILFESDYEKEKVYFDTLSTNVSAFRLSRVLEKLGVRNNKFMLVTTQKDLIGLDVHNLKDPSKELAERIAYEIKINPWYFFREIVRIPIQGGRPIPFKFNRGNLALIYCFLANVDFYLVMPRQTGKSVSSQAIVAYVMYFLACNFKTILLTKDTALVQEMVDRLRAIKKALPQFLLFSSSSDTDNKEGLTYSALENKYSTQTKSNDPFSANNLGRGLSSPFLHWDELEFFKYNYITYPAATSATNAARESAKDNGLPHTNIITSTAGNLDTEECQFALKLISEALPFSEKLYDCKDYDEFHAIVDKHSTRKMVYAVFSYLQLGYTHKWFRETSVRTGGTPEDIARDYLNLRQAGTDSSAIDRTILDKIKASEKEPVQITFESGYMFRWYEHPDKVFKDPNRVIIAGLDTSDNVGKDFTSLVFLDPKNMDVIATTKCNESDLILFARFLGKYLVDHPKVILVPERKSTASMIVGLICEILRKNGINPFTRIYNQVFQNIQEEPFCHLDTWDNLEQGPNKKYLGYSTAGTGSNSRDVLYKVTLNKALSMNASKISDSGLINEFCSLSVKSGRMDHSNKGHDDLVIAYLLACWFIYFGKNLRMYNLDKSIFCSEVDNSGTKLTAKDKVLYSQVTERIAELNMLVRTVTHPGVLKAYESELADLKELISPMEYDITPIRSDDITQQKTIHTPEYITQAFAKIRF